MRIAFLRRESHMTTTRNTMASMVIWKACEAVYITMFATVFTTVLSTMCVTVVHAQVEQQEVLAGEDAQPTSSLQGVFVRDSTAVADKLALAKRMGSLREWTTAADVYQEVIDSASDRLVPVEFDEGGRPVRYAALGLAVQSMIAAWPAEGVEVYRDRFEQSAASLLSDAGDDSELLQKIANRFAQTRSAQQARQKLVMIAFGRGDLATVLRFAKRELELRSDVEEGERVELLVAGALASRLARQSELGERFAEELRKQYPATKLVLGGVERVAADFVRDELTRSMPAQVDAAKAMGPDNWREPLGGNARTGLASDGELSARSPRAFANLFTFNTARQMTPGISDIQMQEIQPEFEGEEQQGLFNGSLPAIDGDELYYADNYGIYGLSLSSGVALPGWMTGDGKSPVNSVQAASTVRGVVAAPTLTDSKVLVVLGQSDAMLERFSDLPGNGAQLIVVNRATGQKAWIMRARDLEVSGPDVNVKNAQFVGSVLVEDKTVFVVARSRRLGQLDDCYLVALELDTGKLKWVRHIASGTASMMGDRFGQAAPLPFVAYPSSSNGSVFVLSDMGAMTSISSSDGSINWLSIYPRPLPEVDEGMRRFDASVTPAVAAGFEAGGVMVVDDKLVTLPVDSDSIFIHSAADGRMIARIPVAAFGNARCVVGGVNGKLILTSINTVWSVDIQKLIDNPKTPAAAVEWSKPLVWPGGGGDANDRTIVGRAALTAGNIYVSTTRHLLQLATSDGRVVARYPRTGEWSESEVPGNIIVTPDAVVVASSDRVSVYADPKVIRQKLLAQVQAAPGQIAPRLRFAQVMYLAGDLQEALIWLDQAVEMGKKSGAAELSKVYEAAMSLALRAADSAKPAQGAPNKASQESAQASAQQLMIRAERAATTTPQKARLIFEQAALAAAVGNRNDAAILLQKILDDKALRSQAVSTGNQKVVAASSVAAQRLRDIIEADRKVVEPIIAAAELRLNEAFAASDLDAIIEVAERYPTVPQAMKALSLAAGIAQEKGDFSSARSLVRRSIALVRSDTQRAPLIEQLMRLEAQPSSPGSAVNSDVIVARLAQLRRIVGVVPLSSAIALAQGISISSTDPIEAAKVLAQIQLGRQSTSHNLPELGSPQGPPLLTQNVGTGVANVRTLLVPEIGFSRPDRVVGVATSGQLLVMDASLSEPMLKLVIASATDDARIFWQGDDLFVVNRKTVACVDTAGKKLRWQASVSSLTQGGEEFSSIEIRPVSGEGDALAGEVSRRRIATPIPINRGRIRRGLIIQNRGRFIQQMPAAQIAIAPAPANREELVSHVKMNGGRLIIATNQGQLVCLSQMDGKINWTTRVSDRSPKFMEIGTDVGAIAFDREGSGGFVTIDLHNGRTLWDYAVPGSQANGLDIRQMAIQGMGQGGAPDGTNGLTGILSIAMTSDDSVVWTEPGQLALRRVTASGDMPSFRFGDPGIMPMTDAAGRIVPGLAVYRDRALVLVNPQQPSQRVRAISLDDGNVVRVNDAERGRPVEVEYGTRGGEGNTSMRVDGDRLYLWNQRRVISFSLADPLATPWERIDDRGETVVADVLFAKDAVVVMASRTAPIGGPATENQLIGGTLSVELYSRQRPRENVESGVAMDFREINLAGEIRMNQWQALSGGIVVCSNARTLYRISTRD